MGEMVTIPREEYERLLAVAEDAEDAAAVARFRARLAAGEEELVPAAVVDRLLAGESPVRVWREHRGLTQSGLARASGVQPGGGRRHRGRAEGRVGAEPEGAGGGAGGGDRRSGLSGDAGGSFDARRCGSRFADLSVDKSARACLPLAGAIPRQPGRRARIGAVRASLAPLGLRRGGGQRTGQLSTGELPFRFGKRVRGSWAGAAESSHPREESPRSLRAAARSILARIPCFSIRCRRLAPVRSVRGLP